MAGELPSTIPKTDCSVSGNTQSQASTATREQRQEELMLNLDSYDEQTLDRLLHNLTDNNGGDSCSGKSQTVDDSDRDLYSHLLAIFPDVCPDWARQEVDKHLDADGTAAEGLVDVIVTQWLKRGYPKRVKKWRLQQELEEQQKKMASGGAGENDTGVSATAAAVDPDEGTLFDWRRRQRDVQGRQVVFDALAVEFPLVTTRSLSQVAKAFKYCLPAAYRFLYKTLALTGQLTAADVLTGCHDSDTSAGNNCSTVNCVIVSEASEAAAAGDPTFARLPFDCPQLLEVRSPRSSGEAEHHQQACHLLDDSVLQHRDPELLAELRFVRSLLADDDATPAALTNVAVVKPPGCAGAESSAATAGPSTSSYECECCYGDFPFDSMCQCPDGHLFCRSCLSAYVKEKVFGSGRLSLQCMAPGCDSAFLRSQLCLAVDPLTLAKLDERSAEDNVRSLSALFRCPNCGWGAEIAEETVAADASSSAVNKVFACQNCEKEVCRLCLVDWDEHFGKRCSEIERDRDTQLRREFEEKMTQARVRVCHQCKASVMKSTGCNHITCRCGAHFCYICRSALPPQDPYSHFCNHPSSTNCICNGKCPVQSSTEEDERRAIQEIRAQGLKRQRDEGLQERPIGAPDQPKRPRHS